MGDPSEDPVPSESGDYVPELAGVDVHGLLEHHLGGVDVEGVVPHELVVDDRRQQVVRGGDGVDVPGEVEVDVPHGVHLGVAPSGGPSFDSEGGSDRGLPEGPDDVLAQFAESLDESDCCDGLSLPGGGGGDRGHDHELPVLLVLELLEAGQGHLRHVPAVHLDLVLGQTDFGCDLPDVLDLR